MSHRLHRTVAPLLLASLVAAFALAATGCAASRPRSPPPPAAAAPAEPAEPEEPPVPEGSLSRRKVDAVLREGPPWLLSRVQVEEVLRKGAFIGWRVVSLPVGWEGTGVRTGDVVTKVNGLAVEKPEDFFTVWSTVAQAKELRIALERDGKAEELAMPIVGEPRPETKEALEREVPEPVTGPMPQPGVGAPRQTIIIRGSAEDPLDAR